MQNYEKEYAIFKGKKAEKKKNFESIDDENDN